MIVPKFKTLLTNRWGITAMVKALRQGVSLITLGLIALLPLMSGAARRYSFPSGTARSPQSLLLPLQSPLAITQIHLPLLANVQLSRPDVVEPGTVVRIDGGDTMVVVNDRLKQGFESAYPATVVELGNSGAQPALDALVQGDIDLAAIGRQLTPAERDQGIVQVTLKREKIAVIVGPDNPFDGDLTLTQFARIFRGEITNWAEVGGESRPIRFVDRPDESEVRLALREYNTFKSAPFASGPTTVKVIDDDTNAVIAELGRDGISYAPASHVQNLDTVRLVSMHNVLPTSANYPYSQARAYAYFNQPSEAAIAFLGYGSSPDGQGNIQAALTAEAEAIATGTPIASAVATSVDETSESQSSPDSDRARDPNAESDNQETPDSAASNQPNTPTTESSEESPGSEISNQNTNPSDPEGTTADNAADNTADNATDNATDNAPGNAPDNAPDNAPLESETLDNAPSDNALSGNTSSDNALSNNTSSDNTSTDSLAADPPAKLPIWFWWALPIVILALLLWRWLGSKTETIAYSNENEGENEGDRSISKTDRPVTDITDTASVNPGTVEYDTNNVDTGDGDPEMSAIPTPVPEFDFPMDDMNAIGMDDISEDMAAFEEGEPLDDSLYEDREAMEAIEALSDDRFPPDNEANDEIDDGTDDVADDFLNRLPEPDGFFLSVDPEIDSPLFMGTQSLLNETLYIRDDVAAWVTQGHTMADTEQYQEADVSFDRALNIESDNVAALAGKGRVALATAKPDEAIAHFTAAANQRPDSAPLALYQGHALVDMQQLDDALEAYDRSTKLDSRLLDAALGKGNVLLALGQPQNAIVCFNHILDTLLKPIDLSATGFSADVPVINPAYSAELLSPKTESLRLPLLSSVDLRSNALQGRGNALLSHGYIGAALDNLRQAANTDPTNPDRWVALGYTLAQLQRTEEAIASFDRALTLDPNHPEAQQGKLAQMAL